MTKSDKSRTGSHEKPTAAPDTRPKAGKKGAVELTENELDTVSGGAIDGYMYFSGQGAHKP